MMYNETSFRQFLFFMFEGLSFFFITHFFRYFIKYRNWLVLPLFKLVPRVLLSTLILGVAVYFVRLTFAFLVGLYNPAKDLEIINFLGLTFIHASIIFVWLVFYFSFHFFNQYNTALKEKAAINEIELKNLKSQLNPHFIFNSLNSIRALVDENPVNSKLAITRLSNILRNSLAMEQKRLTTFGDEMKMVRDYLGLEGMRFEERLRVEYDIEEGTDSFLVPPMMIQTLVENGIKHGVSKLKRGGDLSISANVEKGRLVVKLINSGFYKPDSTKNNRAGLGLANTKRRLDMIFGGDAKFYIENKEHGKVLTYLEIPNSNQLN